MDADADYDELGYGSPSARGDEGRDDDPDGLDADRFDAGEGTQAMPVLGADDEEDEEGRGGRHGSRARYDDVDDREPASGDDYDDDVDDRYYPEPLPENRGRGRKRDKISEEFPGFSGPLGGDLDSEYPGYDNIEVWPETDGLATATVWLGALSLIPGLGLLLAAIALVLGPKARRNIRKSRGTLEGEQLVKTGTTLAFVGIAVSIAAGVGYVLL
ncbi:hypothetical protein Nans01_36370 [Nocardiopsis ansamitocini]|uniref:DUF4190 domain-containing protein n=1 Tax=Nocardiopsis ansamitocini TaxID=1670832 RepID=A0A9W6P8X7_9ACTN|nr:hypothetical protein Nans01_36370 [Nocardiopsis ansamitocini]